MQLLGRTILHYRIIEELGSGGMGTVYRAEDTKLERMVAIKFLTRQVAAVPDERNRFRQEAKAAATLNHSNIATIYNLEEVDDDMFIVMEFIDGQDLRKILGNKKGIQDTPLLPIEKVLQYATQIVHGLQAAHEKGIVHRDIKPANVMINTKGQVKITDFGVAKITGSELLTKTGTVLGTLAYMSPEQLSGESIDLRTDIWSWGVMFYEMISGNRPFHGHHEQAIIYSILKETPKPIQINYPDIPPILEAIITKALAKDPAERYENCEQLLNELQSCVQPPNDERAIYLTKQAKKSRPHKKNAQRLRLNETGFIKKLTRGLSASWKIAGVVLLFAVVGAYLTLQTLQRDVVRDRKVAVLPFINIGKDPADEYISDGVMEDILTQLVKIGDLKVISRTTMMTYKNSNKTLREIAKELNAEVVLEGSVRRDENALRISVQLIDAITDEHLWAETYDEELNQVLVIQSEIAQKIAIALHVNLSPAERHRLVASTTFNVETYKLILKGGYNLARGGREDVEQAIEQFKLALSFDADNARAWAQLATAYARQADLGAMSTEEGYSEARQAAEKALMLEDQLAQAHTIMGWIKRSYDWDWLGAESECRKALELAPGDVTVIRNMANLEKTLGRFDQAIVLMQKAAELDPNRVPSYTSLGFLSLYANRLEEAAAAYEKAIELNPNYPIAHTYLGLVYLLQGNPDKAIAEIKRESDEGWRLYGFAQAYHGAGLKAEADAALKSLITDYGSDSAYQVAAVYAYRGDIDSAFIWLEKAYALHDGGLSELKGDPFMKKLESDPRYADFMKKIKLPI